eukprot:1146076-Pelagomonas_calceolata.AAC.3
MAYALLQYARSSQVSLSDQVQPDGFCPTAACLLREFSAMPFKDHRALAFIEGHKRAAQLGTKRVSEHSYRPIQSIPHLKALLPASLKLSLPQSTPSGQSLQGSAAQLATKLALKHYTP